MSRSAATYIFVSYAHSDSTQVNSWTNRLREQCVVAWRDREQLQLGARWPKVLGEAIASAQALVLFWSASATQSEWVEVEWTTALALRVPVLPVLMDETPLPPALSAIQHATVHAGPDSVTAALNGIRHRADSHRSRSVLKHLAGIPTSPPADALPRLRDLLSTEAKVQVNIQTGGLIAVVLMLVAMCTAVATQWRSRPVSAPPESSMTAPAPEHQSAHQTPQVAPARDHPARAEPLCEIDATSAGRWTGQCRSFSRRELKGMELQDYQASPGNQQCLRIVLYKCDP